MVINNSSRTDYTLEDDLHILTLMTNRVSDYVRGDVVYGNQGMFVSGLPAITLGGILMRIRRLNALREHLSDSGRVALDSAILRHDEAYQDWTNHYEIKLQAEAISRVSRIEQFINEYQDTPNRYEVAFEPEQTRRTMVQEILYMMQRANVKNNDLLKQVQENDTSLKSLVAPDAFQWDDTLEEVYAPDEFWWLYSTLKTEE